MGWYPKKLQITDTVTLSEAELTVLDGVTKGIAAANKAVVLGATAKINALDITALTLDGTLITATPAQINLAYGSLNAVPMCFDHILTTAEVKACNHMVVPAVVGKQFYCTFAAFSATGSVTTSTVITLMESTSSGVVMSQVAAQMTSGTWVGPTTTNAVITKMNTPCVVSEGLLIKDTANNSLTVTTALRVIVVGYYI